MSLSFPNNPTIGQTSTQNGRVFKWSGYAWEFATNSPVEDTRWNLFLPTAPTSLTTTAGNNQVILSWTAPSATHIPTITDYIVQYSSNSGSTWTTFSDGVSSSTGIAVTGLTNGTSYIFRVSAVNGIGTGPWTTTSVSTIPVGDQYFSNVSLLLHLDGTNGSTTFTDSSSSSRTVTSYSGASISTSQSKFGGASASFDGNSYLSISDTNVCDFGTGDYTVEAWVRWQTIDSTAQFLLLGQDNGSFGIYWSGGQYGTNVLRVTINNIGDPLSASFQPVQGQWYHIASSRSSGVSRLYIDGQAVATNSNDTTNYISSSLNIGGTGGSDSGIKGFIDEFRITKNIARYTSNFTPQTAAFTNS